MRASAFKVEGFIAEVTGRGTLLSAVGGAVAAAALLSPEGASWLLAAAFASWGSLAVSRALAYAAIASTSFSPPRVYTPHSAVEGEMFQVRVSMPSFLSLAGARIDVKLDRGLSLEAFRYSPQGARLAIKGRIGQWCLRRLTVEGGDLLGATRLRVELGGEACITVRPRRVPVPSLPGILGEARLEGIGGRMGRSIDYYTFREYQVGDEPRMIEWKATARLGQAIVRETEEARREDAVAVLFIGCLEDYDLDASDSAFEEAARLAYSIVASAVSAGTTVHLYVHPHIMDKPVEVYGVPGLEAAGDAIARGGARCGETPPTTSTLAPLARYERAVAVASRRLPMLESEARVVYPGVVGGGGYG